jgi:hypothetical protein
MALPAKSLGHRYATWFENASGKPLPDPVLAPGTDGDDTWLQQQVRRTHHEWPVVSGCPPSPAWASGTALAQRRLARAVPLVLGKPPPWWVCSFLARCGLQTWWRGHRQDHTPESA